MTGLTGGGGDKRLKQLEAFLAEAADWAETLKMLGGRWGDANGAGLAAYADQMLKRIEQLQAGDR